jgi:hypothetical protein
MKLAEQFVKAFQESDIDCFTIREIFVSLNRSQTPFIKRFLPKNLDGMVSVSFGDGSKAVSYWHCTTKNGKRELVTDFIIIT